MYTAKIARLICFAPGVQATCTSERVPQQIFELKGKSTGIPCLDIARVFIFYEQNKEQSGQAKRKTSILIVVHWMCFSDRLKAKSRERTKPHRGQTNRAVSTKDNTSITMAGCWVCTIHPFIICIA